MNTLNIVLVMYESDLYHCSNKGYCAGDLLVVLCGDPIQYDVINNE